MTRTAISRGLLFGLGGLHLAVVGVLLMLHQRWIVIGTISLGQAVLLLLAIGAGIFAVPAGAPSGKSTRLLLGITAGTAAILPLTALTLAMELLPGLQSIFIALSHDLLAMLSLDIDNGLGVAALVCAAALAGLTGAASRLFPLVIRRAAITGASSVVVAGVFQELIQLMLQYEGPIGDIREFFYSWEGLTPEGAAAIFIASAIGRQLWTAARGRRTTVLNEQQRQRQRMIRAAWCLLGLAILPALAGSPTPTDT